MTSISQLSEAMALRSAGMSYFIHIFFFKITSNKDTERMGLRLKVIPSAGLDHHTTAGFLARQIKFNANDHNLIYTTAKLSANIDN